MTIAQIEAGTERNEMESEGTRPEGNAEVGGAAGSPADRREEMSKARKGRVAINWWDSFRIPNA
jgi:hypothetical protein